MSEIINEHLEVDPFELHITGTAGDIEVWINRNFDFNGLAIGGGESRAGAVRDAIETLEQALRVLRERR